MRADLAVVALLTGTAACAPPGGQPASNVPDSGFAMHRVAGNALVLPAGFRVGVYASRLKGVRFMVVGADSSVYATLTRRGEVVRLRDEDRDGEADTRSVIAHGLRNPHGLAFRGDTLYVAEEHRVIRMAPPVWGIEVIVPDLPAGGGHFTRSVVFRGDEMFVSVGSSCNLCEEREDRRAAVLRFAVDGSGGERYATGLRNSVGLAIHPETGELWATNNDRDRLGDEVPPDRVNILQPGGNYGWPQCYLPGTPNPEYERAGDRCASVIGPAVELPAHSAPLGLTFYTGDQFPSTYHGDLLVALHGSWDRSYPIGYEVVRVPVALGKVAGPPEGFVVGWQVGRRAWGRPVDLLVMPDGSLLISDDRGDRIYRVSYKSETTD